MWRPVLFIILLSGSIAYLWLKKDPQKQETEKINFNNDLEASEKITPDRKELEDKENIEVIVGEKK